MDVPLARDEMSNQTSSSPPQNHHHIAKFLPFVFIFVMALSASQAALPTIIFQQIPQNAKAVFWVSVSTAGQNSLAFVTSGPIGRLSDVMGRKSIMIISVLLCSSPMVSLYATDSVWWYFAFRVVSGIVGFSPQSSSGVFQAYIADCVEPEQRTKVFGWATAVILPAYAMGVLAGTIISDLYDLHVLLLFNVILYGVSLLYVSFIIAEARSFGWSWADSGLCACCSCCSSPTKTDVRDVIHGGASRFESRMEGEQIVGRGGNDAAPSSSSVWYLLFKSKILLYTCIVATIVSLPENGIMYIALLYADAQLHLHGKAQTTANAIFLLAMGFCAVPVNTLLLGWVNRRTSEVFVCGIGIFFTGVHLLVYVAIAFYPHKFVLYTLGAIVSLVFIAYPPLTSILSMSLDEHEQGLGLSLLSAFRKLSGVIGPILFGSVLYPLFSKDFHAPWMCFAVASVVAFAGLFVNFGPLSREYKLMKTRKGSGVSRDAVVIH